MRIVLAGILVIATAVSAGTTLPADLKVTQIATGFEISCTAAECVPKPLAALLVARSEEDKKIPAAKWRAIEAAYALKRSIDPEILGDADFRVITHLDPSDAAMATTTLQQYVNGLPVTGSGLTIATDKAGEHVLLVEGTLPTITAAMRETATVSEAEAIVAARPRSEPQATARATLVAMPDGPAWLVEVTGLLVTVDARSGAVLKREQVRVRE